jgi:hypothetical protein
MTGLHRRLLFAALGGLLVLGACGGSSKSSSNSSSSSSSNAAPATTLDAQQTKDAITKVYTDFFNGANPDLNAKLQLLDDPQKYTNVYMKFANDPTTGPELKGASAQVTNVQVNPDGTATVTYTLNLNGTPTLMNQMGTAVLKNGVWKVSGTTFCDLAALGATTTDPACE